MSGGELVVIKRSGRDGMRYPLPTGYVTLGSDADCHIRVLLPSVSQLHATVAVHRNQSLLRNVSPSGETLLNGTPVGVAALQHGDVITLGDRSLRWEYYTSADARAPTELLPLKLSVRGARGRRRGGRGGRGETAARLRASDAAPRRLEPVVKALLELRHRSSLPATVGGERQVAIVQPQRRGESAAEPTEIKAKVVPKPTNKRVSRSGNPGTSNQSDSARKGARGASSPAANTDSSFNAPRSSSPKKGAKKPADAPKKTDGNTPVKAGKGARNTKTNPENDLAKNVSLLKGTPKKLSNKDDNKTGSNKKKPKTDTDSTPRKSARKVLIGDFASGKNASEQIVTPRKTIAQVNLGLDFSNVIPTDLAAVAARGTPVRASPKGPFVHVATPRPPGRSSGRGASAAKGTPRVNPLLRAATLRAKPLSLTKVATTPKATSAKKKNVIEKIEEPTNIDAQKKSALMALTGRSPKLALTPKPSTKISPKFVIAKASIKKISLSRTSSNRGTGGSASRRKRVTGTPKLTPGKPVDTLKRYTSGSESVLFDTKALMGQKRSSIVVNNPVEVTDLTAQTPAKSRKLIDSHPSPSRSTRRSDAATPTVGSPAASPRKSVLKSPTSPRKHESIKFDLSNLERTRSDSVPTPGKASPKLTPAMPRGRSSVTSVETTSEEDLLLRYTDDSSGSDSPSPRRSGQPPSPRRSGQSPSPRRSGSRASNVSKKSTHSVPVISKLASRSRSPIKSASPSTPRNLTRGSLLVQKVLETPVASPSPSDCSARSGYSRRSTLTKSQFDASSTLQTPSMTENMSKNATLTPEKTPGVTKSQRSTRKLAAESYSIVDLVSINTTHSVDETNESTYDSLDSANFTRSQYNTPDISKSGRQKSTSKGQTLANLSLESSTPMVKHTKKSFNRSSLLKSAIASAIKRRSFPIIASKKSSLSASPKTSNRRSKSLTLSPEQARRDIIVNSKRSSRSKVEIVIDDSADIDSTITPNTRGSKGTVTPGTARSARSSKSSSGSKSTATPGTTRSARSSKSTPTKTPLNSPSGKVSKTPTLLPNSKGSPSKKSTNSRQSKSFEEFFLHSPDASRSLRRSAGQSPANSSITGQSTTMSSLSGQTPVIFNNISAPSTSPSSKSGQKQSANKGRSASFGDASSTSRSNSRGSKVSPRLHVGRHSGQGDGPSTPENDISPSVAGTPVLNIQNLLNQSRRGRTSVKETVKRFEAISTPRSMDQPKKVTRKTLGAIEERILARRSDLERQGERKGWTDPKKKGKGIAKKHHGKDNLSAVIKLLARTRNGKRISDENSVASDKTDENAPKPDNETVITPKTTVQLVPEAVKGKHSTAKKPVSRKSIIDHLDISQDIVKNLFNSPVKRMLSQSITQYSNAQLSDDEANISRRSSKRSSSGKTPNVSFDFDSVKTPRVPTEMFVSPMDTPAPASPNLVGVKRLYARNTPKNDLRNVRGVKALLKTPRTKKSPKNDLTNVAGVKALLGSTKKGKVPRDDLTEVMGVKRLLGSARKQSSPKNDLTRVSGVRGLFVSGSKKRNSPKNDLSNVAGVKKLLKTPRGKPNSPKNDLTDIRGVRSLFRQDKSVRNALDELSGIEELFGTSSSTIKEPDTTFTEFDKFVGKTRVKSYSRAKSFIAKKQTPNKQRTVKSVDANVSQSNVEEWLDKELEMRSKRSKNRLSKSFQETSIISANKTPDKSLKVAQPKSARIERVLKNLTIDAVSAVAPITPDRRSRRALTAEKSSYSIEVSKALTPTKKKLSIPEIVTEHISLPLKKRSYSGGKSKTPKRMSSKEVLSNSAEDLRLEDVVERLSLPIKKRVLKSHGALGHSTPVKNRRAKSTTGGDADSVDLGPVSPIASSPNVTPLKRTSLGAQNAGNASSNSILLEPKLSRSAKKGPPKAQKGKTKKSSAGVTKTTPSPVRAVPRTRKGRGGSSNNTTESSAVPKKTTRTKEKTAQKDVTVNTSKTTSPKLVVPKRAPRGEKSKGKQNVSKIASPKSTVSSGRGRRRGRHNLSEAQTSASKNEVKNEQATKKPAPRSIMRKGRNVSASNATDSPALVVAKKAPKLSPQKPEPKSTRGRKAAPKAEEPKPPSPKKATRGRKATAISPKQPPVKSAPKTNRGRKAAQPQSPEAPEKQIPARGRRKRQNEDTAEVSSPKSMPRGTRGRARQTAEEKHESPKRSRKRTAGEHAQKHVSFAPESRTEPSPAPKHGGKRKQQPASVEAESEKPRAKRGRPAAVEPSPAKTAPRRSRQAPAQASPKPARATRATRRR